MQPVVILLIAGSAMFIMIGGLSLLSHYYTLNGIKSRTVGDGQYGTARFATPKEIAETYESIPYEPRTFADGTGNDTGKYGKSGKTLCTGGYRRCTLSDDRSSRGRKDSAFSIP